MQRNTQETTERQRAGWNKSGWKDKITVGDGGDDTTGTPLTMEVATTVF